MTKQYEEHYSVESAAVYNDVLRDKVIYRFSRLGQHHLHSTLYITTCVPISRRVWQ